MCICVYLTYIGIMVSVFSVGPRDHFQQLLHRSLGGEATPFLGLLHFTLDTHLKMLSDKQAASSIIFESLI